MQHACCMVNTFVLVVAVFPGNVSERQTFLLLTAMKNDFVRVCDGAHLHCCLYFVAFNYFLVRESCVKVGKACLETMISFFLNIRIMNINITKREPAMRNLSSGMFFLHAALKVSHNLQVTWAKKNAFVVTFMLIVSMRSSENMRLLRSFFDAGCFRTQLVSQLAFLVLPGFHQKALGPHLMVRL